MQRFAPQLRMTIVCCSSEDEVFPVSELQARTPLTSGWQSAKHCEYPQELGFRFEGVVDLQHLRLLSHETKVATRIEVFIAEATDEEREAAVFPSYESAVFRRLGHVNLASNEEHNYSVRELKTVNVGKRALYLKLIVRKNHTNSINVFNQVGIVALSAHGAVQQVFKVPQNDHELIVGDDDEVPMEQIFVASKAERQRNINDDGFDETFGGTLDSNTGRKVRELTLHKARAVEAEDYDLAKALKEQIEVLRHSGGQIAMLEAQKQLAVDSEDYDTAKKLKMQIDELRAKATGKPHGSVAPPRPPHARAAHPQAGATVTQRREPSADGHPNASRPPKSNDEYPAGASAPESVTVTPRAPASMRPGRANRPVGNDDVCAMAGGPKSDDDETGGIVVKESKAPALSKEGTVPPTSEKYAKWETTLNKMAAEHIGDNGNPESLPANKAGDYRDYVNGFGVFVGSCLFNKRWQLREAALKTLSSPKGIEALAGSPGGSAGAIATLLQYAGLNTHGINDTLAQVFFATCDAISGVVSGALLPKGTTIASVSPSIVPLLSELMLKAGDNNSRVRERAVVLLMQLAASPIGPERISAAALSEPESPGGSKKPLNHRIHIARINVVQSLLDEVGFSTKERKTGLVPDGVMQKLCMPCLQHSHQDVREAAQKLVATVALHNGPAPLEKYLSTLKPAQRQIIDELISAAEPSPVKKEKEKVEPEMVSSSFSVGHGQEDVLKAARAARDAPEAPTKKKSDPPSKKDKDASKSCHFCTKHDDRFTKHTLDLHYVQTCPMLCPCPLCGQVTEISQLQTHLVQDCERKSLVKQCPSCLEAVRAEDLDAHVAAKECIAANPTKYSLCPLCHAKLSPGSDAWVKHLAAGPGCPNNPRHFSGGNGEEFQ